MFSPTLDVSLTCLAFYMLTLHRIIGDILEYHFLCRNPTYNAPQYTSAIRENILQHLRIWLDSFSKNLPPKFCEIISITSEIPALAYYALYLYHCLHILLYGQMDLIRMYEDTGWQASSDFLVVGEHAIVCANVSIQLSSLDSFSTLRSVDSLFTPLDRQLYHPERSSPPLSSPIFWYIPSPVIFHLRHPCQKAWSRSDYSAELRDES